MAKYFYANADGQREGPVCREQLQELVTQGIIEPDTLLLRYGSGSGIIAQAKNILELSFNPDSQEQETQT